MLSEKRVQALDGVRGTAILLVLMVHFQSLTVLPYSGILSRWIVTAMSWGWSGVDLFFVLSGFLITGILLDKRNVEKHYGHFFTRRTLRIFPLYYAVVLPSLCTAGLIEWFRRHGSLGPNALGWTSYLLYLQNWWIPFGQLHRMVFLGPLWSLAIEEQFYLIWPLCVWRLSINNLVRLCVTGVGVAFVLRWLLMLPGSTALAFVAYMNTFTRMDGLLTGALSAIVVRNGNLLQHAVRVTRIAMAVVVIGLFFLISEGHRTWNDRQVMVVGHLLLSIGFGCLVLLAYVNNGSKTLLDRIFHSKMLTSLGRYSYGIYVYQGIIFTLALHLVREKTFRKYPVGFAFEVGICWMAAVTLVAVASYHLFEKKFLRVKYSAEATLQISV